MRNNFQEDPHVFVNERAYKDEILSGLMAMSMGHPLITEGQDKAIHIDRKTGEVTLKFRLPGFSREKE